MHPFRFGVQVTSLPFDSWRERVRWYEDLGFTAVHTPDHYLLRQWDPVALLAAVAGATRSAAVGSTVFNVGFRHPIDLARAAATLAGIAAGGCELGLGAGWSPDDDRIAGAPAKAPKERLARLRETVEAVRRLWTEESTTCQGDYVTLDAAPSVLPLPLPRMPKLLLGGTMRHALALAGTHADIVSVFPSLATGSIGWPGWAAGSTHEQTARQTAWALEPGRDPELSTQIPFTAVADDPQPLQQRVAETTGVAPQAQNASTIFLTGTPQQARDSLRRRREETGLSYFIIFDTAYNYANTGPAQTLAGDDSPDRYLEALAAEVVRPLTGQ